MTFFSRQADAFEAAVEAQQKNESQEESPGQAEEPEMDMSDIRSEVQTRIQKAKLYDLILSQPLFSDDDSDAAYEVEQEFRAFAEERLQILLGMKQEVQKVEPVNPFDMDQEEILRQLADRLLAKPHLIGVLAGSTSAQPKLNTVQTQTTPAPQPKPEPPKQPKLNTVQTAKVQQPAKKRGRPPGTGKNQRAAAAQQPVQKAENLPEGVFLGEDGKKYIEQDGFDQVTGKPKKVRVEIQEKPDDLTSNPHYRPMPLLQAGQMSNGELIAEDTAGLQMAQMQAMQMTDKLTRGNGNMAEVLQRLLR